jgi:hypothetical protein
MNLPQGEAGKRRSLDRRANRVGHLCCVGRAKLTASEIDLVRDELAYDGLLIKTYVLMCCLSPITRSRRGPPRESRNSFVALAPGFEMSNFERTDGIDFRP